MIEKVDIAIVGAASSVGETLIDVLSERQFPVGQIYLLESEMSSGSRIEFNGEALKFSELSAFDFAKVKIAFFVSSEEVSKQFAEKAAATGCVVIDRSPAFRKDNDVPLIIPEINQEAMDGFNKRNIISSPSCVTIQMLMALKPVYDAVGIKSINVATYQAVSGSGKDAAEELASQTAALLNFRDVKCKAYTKQIAFNALPQVGEFLDNGYTNEEMKLLWETQKVFNDDSVSVNATTVRIPVFIGHAASLHVETREKISASKVKNLLHAKAGIKLFDENQAGDDGQWPTAVTDAAGNDLVCVGRIRENLSSQYGVNMWVVTDNMRKGASTNIVQIAEILLEQYLK